MAQWKDTAPEPADALATIEQLRDRVQRLHAILSDVEEALGMALAEKDAAHKAGYEMARRHAAERGWHLVRYEVAMMKERGK